MPGIFDTHTHLNDKRLSADLRGVLSRAAAQGVDRMICAGYNLETSRRAVSIAARCGNVWATVGMHPHDAARLTDEGLAELAELAGKPKVVGIGETGLDYYRNLSPRPVQETAFRAQLRLARELRLPVVIHNRNAGRDILRIIEDEDLPAAGGVMHCFSEDADYAVGVVGLGFYVGIAGPVTYGGNEKLWRVVREIPADRLLIETDAPYLTPQPFRGRRGNEPALIRYVAEKVAELWGVDVQTVARLTSENAGRLFRGVERVERGEGEGGC